MTFKYANEEKKFSLKTKNKKDALVFLKIDPRTYYRYKKKYYKEGWGITLPAVIEKGQLIRDAITVWED